MENLALTPVTSMHYLIVSLILFAIGTVGVLTRRNAIIIMMSIERKEPVSYIVVQI